MGILTKLYTTINNKIIFDIKKEHPSVQEQISFLNDFGDPKDVIERSYSKYQCLLFYCYSKKQKVFLNTLCALALLVLLPIYRIKGIRHDKKLKHYKPEDRLLRKAAKRIPITDIFPSKLSGQYKESVDYEGVSYSQIYMTKDASSYLWRAIRRYPFRFHYHMVLLIRLSQASYLLSRYTPACITTYVCERKFADPILTEYYASHDVRYHGFMHGDYLFSIEQAFMHYTKYWVWAKHYEDLFRTLRCDFDTEIYKPGKYSGIVKPRESVDQYDYYATYYFSDETEESVEIVKNALLKLQEAGHRCKVRPHPRFSNKELILKEFQGIIDIEDTNEMTIEASLECSYLTITQVSTVLSQAYYSGKKIVIDDISNPKAFGELREKRYILIDKADMLFSELLNQEEHL